MALTDAQRRASNKYNLAHYTVVGCKIRKEEAEAFKQACKDRGTSPNEVFRQAIERFMEDGYGISSTEESKE